MYVLSFKRLLNTTWIIAARSFSGLNVKLLVVSRSIFWENNSYLNLIGCLFISDTRRLLTAIEGRFKNYTRKQIKVRLKMRFKNRYYLKLLNWKKNVFFCNKFVEGEDFVWINMFCMTLKSLSALAITCLRMWKLNGFSDIVFEIFRVLKFSIKLLNKNIEKSCELLIRF